MIATNLLQRTVHIYNAKYLLGHFASARGS